MSNMYTLKDINGGDHRLGNAYEQELEEKIRSVTAFNSEINDLTERLIKTLKREGTLAQKASFVDKIKIISLEVKVRELEGKLEDSKPDLIFHNLNEVGETIEDLTQTNPKVIDSLRLELERVKGDLNSKEYTIEYWVNDNLKPLVYKLGFENKVMELDKRFARENILEDLQELLPQNEMVLKSGVPTETISQVESLPNQFVHSRPTNSEKYILKEEGVKQLGGAEAGSLISPLITYSFLTLLLIAIIWFIVKKIQNWWSAKSKEKGRYPTHKKYINREEVSDRTGIIPNYLPYEYWCKRDFSESSLDVN
ncbi:hypothetical protein RclHR1_04030015 [Rhizophagus clarus]|uniref:Uncharacterized protein n=1 Tax=Rhizophagus clarus TaxID=94130 RepID=A0A2Z6RVK4_9GLOM|nr:hypothetical protein RclHR1_04030015 [Rhizophagus clarus]